MDFSPSAHPPFSILVLNGPNLGYLGERQPELYGRAGLDALPALVDELLGSHARDVSLEFFQSNGEGALIDRLERARQEKMRGVVLNAGAYTHTSLALADCIAWIGIPVIEVHLTNVFARKEPIRRQSYMGEHVLGVISGFGLMSYALAVRALLMHLKTVKL